MLVIIQGKGRQLLPYRKLVFESMKVSYEFNQTFVVATMETKDILRIHFLIHGL